MITCQKCLERMKPEDPRIPTGKYHHSSCDYYCSKPDYERELEQGMKQDIIERHISYQNVDGKQLSLLRKNLIDYIDEKLSTKNIKYTIKETSN